MRSAKHEPIVEPQGGIGLYHPERDRPAGSRCLFDQAFDYLRPNAAPSQRAVYEKLADEQRVVLHEALQPTNIGPVESDDANLPHVPSLTKGGHLSVHV